MVLATVGLTVLFGFAAEFPAGAFARPKTAPRFIAVHARLLAIAPGDEIVFVRARVENSASCRVELVSPVDSPRPHVAGWRSCRTGRFTERVGLEAAADVAEVRLFARSHLGATVVRDLIVSLRQQKNRTGRETIAALISSRQQSNAWAGYVSTSNSPTTMVSARWTIASITCGAENTWLGTWIGVDGAEATGPGTHAIFQDGIYSFCLDGQQHNEAWWEAYPGPANPLGAANTGDTIAASVWKTDAGWMWSVADTSTGTSYASTAPVSYAGPGGSAEWVVEDPGTPSEPFVEGFAPITFENMAMRTSDGASFTDGSTWQMIQNQVVLATPVESANAITSRHTLTIRSGGRPF